MANGKIERPVTAAAFATVAPVGRDRGRRSDRYNRSAERRGCLVVSLDDAEIRGRFEGSLTVRKRILIRSTGIVVGTIRYGQIEIEPGGQISGDVQIVERPD